MFNGRQLIVPTTLGTLTKNAIITQAIVSLKGLLTCRNMRKLKGIFAINRFKDIDFGDLTRIS
jgi:hypothetical protein